MKKVAIISVNFNGQKDTLEFLESLKKLDNKNLETKTIVVDNASSDKSVKLISEKYPEIDLVQTGKNLGFTGGYNKGLTYALAWGADYYLIINNDTLINSPDLLSELIKTAELDTKIGIVAPKILFAPGFEFQQNYTKEDIGKIIWYGGGSFDWNNVMSSHRGIDEVDKGQYDNIEKTDFVSGCCLLFKKEVLEKVGMFDERLFAYFDDNDLSERLKLKGFIKYYCGKVSIYHKVSQTTGIGSPLADYFVTRNRLIFGFRYARFRTKFALLRQALMFLLTGRKMQKEGVIDFLLGKTGANPKLLKSNPDPQYPLKLSITIVNYNTANLVKNLLESIYNHKSGFDKKQTEVILLDNGSLDPCTKFIKDYPQVKYIQNIDNVGFAKGYNRCIKFSRGEYNLMLNSDIEVLDQGLSEILKAAEEKEQAIIGGKLYFPDLSDQDSCFNLPTISGALKEYFLGKKGAYFMFLPKSEKPIKVEGFIMACFLIPQKVLDKIGLLDEGTFMFFEDIEYCRRAKEKNVPLYFYPNAKFIHHHGASSKQLKEGEAYKMLVKGSLHYHGRFYYSLLYLVMLLGQKFSSVKTPVAR